MNTVHSAYAVKTDSNLTQLYPETHQHYEHRKHLRPITGS